MSLTSRLMHTHTTCDRHRPQQKTGQAFRENVLGTGFRITWVPEDLLPLRVIFVAPTLAPLKAGTRKTCFTFAVIFIPGMQHSGSCWNRVFVTRRTPSGKSTQRAAAAG